MTEPCPKCYGLRTGVDGAKCYMCGGAGFLPSKTNEERVREIMGNDKVKEVLEELRENLRKQHKASWWYGFSAGVVMGAVLLNLILQVTK